MNQYNGEQLMRRVTLKITVLLFFLSLATAAFGWNDNATDSGRKIVEASGVLEEIFSIPERTIPPSLLSNARAIVVLPGLLKAGFIVGGRYGTGLLIARAKDGTWLYPVMVSLTGASIGWQIGAQSTDIVLVFKDLRSVETIEKGKFTLGADASVAAGPVGRHAEASTDIQFRSEIYSYSRSRGLFAGLALEGGALLIDHDATWAFYSRPAYDLLHKKDLKKIPLAAKQFRQVVMKYAQ
jgi:lipid-binding SYLF domain-containing protein